MKQNFQKFKRRIIKKVCQNLADIFIIRLQNSLSLEDDDAFYAQFEIAAKLNAYCIVFHDIYLD